MSTQTLYLLLGYPGSGKTTTSKIIHELTGAVHLWADHERRNKFKTPTHSHQENLELYAELNQRTDDLLGLGKSVIFDTNFNFYKDREHLRQIAAKHNAKTKLIWIKTNKDVSKKRATQAVQDHETRVLGNMSADDFDRMSGNLQPPIENEPYIEIDGTNVTRDYVAQQLGL